MLGRILGKKNKNTTNELTNKISNMNLTEMRSYINNKQTNFPIDKSGLLAVITKLALPDTMTGELYIQASDMDSKKKKAFDIVLLIAKQKKMNMKIIDMLQKFIDNHQEMISEYDTRLKEIYGLRLTEAIGFALASVAQIDDIKHKMKILNPTSSSKKSKNL